MAKDDEAQAPTWIKVVRRKLRRSEQQVLRALRGRVRTVADVAALLQRAVTRSVGEGSWVIHLDPYGQVISLSRASVGDRELTLVSVELVYRTAILSGASVIILAHNHPAGALVPSRSDLEATLAIMKAGEAVGIRCIDHVIVTGAGHVSIFDYFLSRHERRKDVPPALERELRGLVNAYSANGRFSQYS